MTPLFFVGGCAALGAWYKPGATEMEFYADRAACEGQAAAAYPVMLQTSGGYQGPAQTRCTTNLGVTNCQTTPGIAVPGVTNDVNLPNRLGMFGACMRGRGYTYRVGG